MVLGTDKIKLSNRGIEIPSLFENNAILIAEEAGHWNDKIIFLNGLPFKIVGEIKNKKTEFLDSLGLSSFRDNINYIIPIETMFRLTLDDTIDTIDVVKDSDINSEDIVKIKQKLIDNNITDFTIRSILDAKEAVGNVLNRFALLTNSVYTLLTVMMLVIIVTVCRRAFQSRSTEFALKVIHGIDKRIIIHTVIIEMILITLVGVFFYYFYNNINALFIFIS